MMEKGELMGGASEVSKEVVESTETSEYEAHH
jgi:hypothetical protein